MGKKKVIMTGMVIFLTAVNIWMARYVIRPLKERQKAAREIREKQRAGLRSMVVYVEDKHPIMHLQEAMIERANAVVKKDARPGYPARNAPASDSLREPGPVAAPAPPDKPMGLPAQDDFDKGPDALPNTVDPFYQASPDENSPVEPLFKHLLPQYDLKDMVPEKGAPRHLDPEAGADLLQLKSQLEELKAVLEKKTIEDAGTVKVSETQIPPLKDAAVESGKMFVDGKLQSLPDEAHQGGPTANVDFAGNSLILGSLANIKAPEMATDNNNNVNIYNSNDNNNNINIQNFRPIAPVDSSNAQNSKPVLDIMLEGIAKGNMVDTNTDEGRALAGMIQAVKDGKIPLNSLGSSSGLGRDNAGVKESGDNVVVDAIEHQSKALQNAGGSENSGVAWTGNNAEPMLSGNNMLASSNAGLTGNDGAAFGENLLRHGGL